MKKPVLLRVRPNPYFALDANGMPAGLVRVDPEAGRPGVIEFVGAKVLKTPTDEKDNKAREPMYRRRATLITFAQEPVEILATPYHVEQVRSGALIAADKETARACLIWFVEPAAAPEQAKAKAIADWLATTGEKPPVEDWPGALKPAEAKAPVDPAEEVLAAPFLTPEMLAAEAANKAAPAAEVK